MIQKFNLFEVEGIYFMNAKRRLEELLFKIGIKQGHQDLFERSIEIDKELCSISLNTEEKAIKRSL